MDGQFIITAKAENGFCVLQRLSSLMSRKRLQFQEIKLVNAEMGRSHLVLTLWTDSDSVQWLMKRLAKFVDLSDLQMTMPVVRNPDWQSDYNHSRGFCLF